MKIGAVYVLDLFSSLKHPRNVSKYLSKAVAKPFALVGDVM